MGLVISWISWQYYNNRIDHVDNFHASLASADAWSSCCASQTDAPFACYPSAKKRHYEIEPLCSTGSIFAFSLTLKPPSTSKLLQQDKTTTWTEQNIPIQMLGCDQERSEGSLMFCLTKIEVTLCSAPVVWVQDVTHSAAVAELSESCSHQGPTG
jgi:hypothetical protein